MTESEEDSMNGWKTDTGEEFTDMDFGRPIQKKFFNPAPLLH